MGNRMRLVSAIFEELFQFTRADILVADFGIVSRVSLEKLFVNAQKGRRVHPAHIPHKHRPSRRFENAAELGSRPLRIKPMESLRRDDELDIMIRQSRGLSSADD